MSEPPAKRPRVEDSPDMPLDMLAREIPRHFEHLDDLVQFASLCWTLRRTVTLPSLLETLYRKIMCNVDESTMYPVAAYILDFCKRDSKRDPYWAIRRAWIVITRIFNRLAHRAGVAWLGRKLDLLFGSVCVERRARPTDGVVTWLAERQDLLPTEVLSWQGEMYFSTLDLECHYQRGDEDITVYWVNPVKTLGESSTIVNEWHHEDTASGKPISILLSVLADSWREKDTGIRCPYDYMEDPTDPWFYTFHS